jgi:hypothetical protein
MRATILVLAAVVALMASVAQAQTYGTVSSRGIVVRGVSRTPAAVRTSAAVYRRPVSQVSAASIIAQPAVQSSPQVTSSTPLYSDNRTVRTTARPVYYTANQAVVTTSSPCATCGCSPCTCAPATSCYVQQPCPTPTLGADCCNPCQTCAPACAPCCPTRRVGLRPVIDVGTRDPCLQMGRGILGQPKVYVPGQPVRNFVRWLTP